MFARKVPEVFTSPYGGSRRGRNAGSIFRFRSGRPPGFCRDPCSYAKWEGCGRLGSEKVATTPIDIGGFAQQGGRAYGFGNPMPTPPSNGFLDSPSLREPNFRELPYAGIACSARIGPALSSVVKGWVTHKARNPPMMIYRGPKHNLRKIRWSDIGRTVLAPNEAS